MKHAFIFILLFAGITCAEKSFSQLVIQKQKDIGGSAYDELHGVYVTRDGGLIAGGISYSNKSGDKTQNIRGKRGRWRWIYEWHYLCERYSWNKLCAICTGR